MNERFIESRKIIAQAREALKNGNMTEARQLAERAAEIAPQSEDPWLILAAVVSPRESMKYIRRALEANPNSPRAKKGMEWAMQRLGEKPKAGTSPEITPASSECVEGQGAEQGGKKSKKAQPVPSHPLDPDGMRGLRLRCLVCCDLARPRIHFEFFRHAAG